MATFAKFNEAEVGSLALRLALSPLKASPDRVTPSHARSATCQTGNLQGELLSVHKIDQAWPGAPGFTGLTGLFWFSTFILSILLILSENCIFMPLSFLLRSKTGRFFGQRLG
jgi:hypothetical protein